MLRADLVRPALAAGNAGWAPGRFGERRATGGSERGALADRRALRCCGLAENDAEVLLAAAAAYPTGCLPLEQALAFEEAGAALCA